MACVPPRAGSDTAQQFPIAQGVPLSSHCKMKQILARSSSLWHKSCRGWPPVWNVRNMASQAVFVEEMEASDASEKKTMHWQRWQAHETMVLIAAKRQQDLRGVDSTEAAGIESKKTKNKWKEIEAICREKGIERSAQQCQARWSRLTSAFTQIRSWEETRKPEQTSFWSLKLDERKTMGFLSSLDQKTYNALDELYNSKADAIGHALVKDDVEELVELGSINHMPHGNDGKNCNANKADVTCSRTQGEVSNKTNSLTRRAYKRDEMVQAECLNIHKPIHEENNESDVREDIFFSEELEECEGEKQADRCKAMESTKILSAYLQMVVDDSEGIEKGADGNSSETNASVTESLVARGIANANSVSALLEECRKSNSHLSSTGVDDLNANQSRQGALSCISIDEQDCKNHSEDESLAEEACIDKNEKGKVFFEVCEGKSKNAEDILTAWADNIQSNCIEAQNKNTRPEQQQGGLNPLLASKEEIGTGVLKQVPEVNSTFPRIEIFESSAQAKDSEKIELQPSEEVHVEMIADMAERNADGNNKYDEKTTEPSKNIEHFEVIVKDAESYVKREPCEQSQSVYVRDRSDTIERMEVAIKEGEYLTEKIEIRRSTVKQKSTIKGDGESFESACGAKRAEVLEVAAKEFEFTIKDDRESPVTSGEGSIEDQSQKTTTSSIADEDVFMNIPAATGNLVRSAVQTVRNFFKF